MIKKAARINRENNSAYRKAMKKRKAKEEKSSKKRYNNQDFLTKGIYYLYRGDRIVYVGQSKTNCMSRVAKHYDEQTKDFDRFRIRPMPNLSDSQIDHVEMRNIQIIKPQYNIIHNT